MTRPCPFSAKHGELKATSGQPCCPICGWIGPDPLIRDFRPIGSRSNYGRLPWRPPTTTIQASDEHVEAQVVLREQKGA